MKLTLFSDEGNWYKGNLHTHSTISDGHLPVAETKEQYVKKGYSFIAITDHNIYFNSSEYNEDNFIIIPGIETNVTKPNWNGQHMVGIYDPKEKEDTFEHGKVLETLAWSGDFNDLDVLQEQIEILRKGGNQCIYPHPKYGRILPETMLKLNGYFAMEIWNNESVYDSGCGEALYHWDHLLRNNKKVWGIASDDKHQSDDRYIGGYVVVKAKELTVSAILQSLKAGNFYSSAGPEIYDFYVEDGIAYAKTSDAKAIGFICYEAHGKVYLPPRGRDTFNEQSHELRVGTNFVRLEVEDKFGKKAWSNPIFL